MNRGSRIAYVLILLGGLAYVVSRFREHQERPGLSFWPVALASVVLWLAGFGVGAAVRLLT